MGKLMVKQRNLLIAAALALILVLITTPIVSAFPPMSTEIYGRAYDSNFNITTGSTIEVLDAGGQVCGTFTVQNRGAFGLLTCKGDDPETSADEGAQDGDLLSFRVNGNPAAAWSNITYEEGTFKNLTISIPTPNCGDDLCDFHFESAFTCPADCELGNATDSNQTGNVTPPDVTPGDDGGAGGGGGGGGGAGGGGGGGGGATGGLTGIFPGTGPQGCDENWNCTEWSECTIEETRSRTCTDLNQCGTNESIPDLVESCEYIPTCFDGVKNGLETDVDCGGRCPSCDLGESCQNHQDCKSQYCVGGVCREMSCEDAAIFCSDGLKNCGEEGIDCGGPCEQDCPVQERPGILPEVFVCQKDVNPLDNNSIVFFIVILAGIIGRGYYLRKKLKEIEQDLKPKKKEKVEGETEYEDLSYAEELELLQRKFSEKRKFWMFVSTVVSLAIILYLYYYYFFLCETEFRYIWWLVGLVIASPFIIHYGLRIYEYSEEEKLKKLRKLSDRHYQQVMRLIELENSQLEDMEREISRKMQALSQDEGFKEALASFPQFKKVYKDMVELYLEYSENQTPYDLEKDLCEQIYELETDKDFQKLAENYPEIKAVYNRLRFLYQQYEEKQKLYEQLDKIEEGWEVDEEKAKQLEQEAQKPVVKKEDKSKKESEDDDEE